jgi:hypothetical protein
MRWLKTTEIYFLTVLEAGSMRSGIGQGHALSEALGRNPFHASLAASGDF